MRSGEFKTQDPELALRLGACAFFQETLSLLRGLTKGRSLLWPGRNLGFPLAGEV